MKTIKNNDLNDISVAEVVKEEDDSSNKIFNDKERLATNLQFLLLHLLLQIKN